MSTEEFRSYHGMSNMLRAQNRGVVVKTFIDIRFVAKYEVRFHQDHRFFTPLNFNLKIPVTHLKKIYVACLENI